MKYLNFSLTIAVLVLGCKKQQQYTGTETEISDQSHVVAAITDSTAQGFLTEFYQKFYGEYNNRDGFEKYVSAKLLDKINFLSEKDNLILDYDPFIQAQDYDASLIRKSLEVSSLKNKNEFRVSFILPERNGRTFIDLLLRKNSKEKFEIYSILNDEYLSSIDDSTPKVSRNDAQHLNINGDWSLVCENNLTRLEITNTNGVLSLNSFNAVFINIRVEKSAVNNIYNLRFASTLSQQQYYPDKLTVNDDEISKDSIIGEFVLKQNAEAQLHWKGLYNLKKKKRDFTDKDFLLIAENGGSNYIILEKCK